MTTSFACDPAEMTRLKDRHDTPQPTSKQPHRHTATQNCLHPMTPPGDGRRQLRSGTGAPPQRGCTQKTDPCLETIYFPKSLISRAN